jgi:hypothetical protein
VSVPAIRLAHMGCTSLAFSTDRVALALAPLAWVIFSIGYLGESPAA